MPRLSKSLVAERETLVKSLNSQGKSAEETQTALVALGGGKMAPKRLAELRSGATAVLGSTELPTPKIETSQEKVPVERVVVPTPAKPRKVRSSALEVDLEDSSVQDAITRAKASGKIIVDL